MRADSVLEFWFGTLDGGFSDERHRRMWWQADESTDQAVRQRFGPLIAQAAAGHLDSWLATPRGRLAFILVSDQFPRHVHRGTPAAFANDTLALETARYGVEKGADRELALDERSFFYLPFEHSESLVDQHTAVGLFSQLRDETPAGQRHLTGENLRHAHQHRDIISRFGRFPHRNSILGRQSTSLELAYLEGATTYGQGT